MKVETISELENKLAKAKKAQNQIVDFVSRNAKTEEEASALLDHLQNYANAKAANKEYMRIILAKANKAFSLTAQSIDLLDEIDIDLSGIAPEGFKDVDTQSALQDILCVLDYMVDDDHNDEYSGEYCIEKKAQKIMNKMSEYSYA